MILHLILLLFFISYLQTINSNEIALNIKKQNQPLIFAALQEREENLVNPITIPATYHGENIEFRLSKKLQPLYHLSAACPPENLEEVNFNQTIINKYDNAYMTLFEKKNIDDASKYCKNPLIPSVTITDPQIECGNNEKDNAKLYHVGYWVNVNNPNTNQDKKILEFVTIYKICHDGDTMIFTWHILEPGQNSQYKIPQEEFEKLKFFTAFGKSQESKILPKQTGKIAHQFVPYDDMIPNTWKTSTLFDINTIAVYERIKPKLNEIDNFIRNYSTMNSISFKIYSGVVNDLNVTGNYDFFWYWKIIQKGNSGVAIMVGLIESLDPLEESDCGSPCSSDDNVCSLSNLEKLVNPNECMFCCEVDDVVRDLRVAIGSKDGYNESDKLSVLGLLKFNDHSDISLKYPNEIIKMKSIFE